MMVNEVNHIRHQVQQEKSVPRLRSWVEKLLGYIADQEKELSALRRQLPAITTGIVDDPRGRPPRDP
jgi:hypothetical protein